MAIRARKNSSLPSLVLVFSLFSFSLLLSPALANSYSKTCTHQWNSTQFLGEKVIITASITDAHKDLASDSVVVQVVNHTVGESGGGSSQPSNYLNILITSPSNGSQVSGIVEIKASAKGPSELGQMSLSFKAEQTGYAFPVSNQNCRGGGTGGGGKLCWCRLDGVCEKGECSSCYDCRPEGHVDCVDFTCNTHENYWCINGYLTREEYCDHCSDAEDCGDDETINNYTYHSHCPEYYTCPDGTKVPRCQIIGTGCACKSSPQDQCPESPDRGEEKPDQGEEIPDQGEEEPEEPSPGKETPTKEEPAKIVNPTPPSPSTPPDSGKGNEQGEDNKSPHGFIGKPYPKKERETNLIQSITNWLRSVIGFTWTS